MDIDICREFALNKKGLCLSFCYNFKHMLWQCELGHQWQATWKNIKNHNSWCPICQKNKTKVNISVLKEHAKSKNGELLSTEYKNNASKLLWKCEKGHNFEASWNHVSSNKSWCFKCFHNSPDISTLQKHAILKDGKLLSNEYINNNSKLSWECSKGHHWEAVWTSIKDGETWCPKCKFKTELKCKELFEQKLNIKFEKKRFYYDLKNVRKFIEFDGYNEENKIAFEYNGYQHYIFPNRYHKTLKQFENLKKLDDFKEQFAIEHGIRLIIIPYIEENNLYSYIERII